MTPEKVKDNLQSIINKKILVLIFGLALIFQIFVYTASDSNEKEYIIAAISILNPLIASFVSFMVAKRYEGSSVFGKAYAILGIGLFMMFLGESTWYSYIFVYHIEPYPSIADIFFFAFYPRSMAHILMNVRFFNTKIDTGNKIWILVLPISIVLIYTVFSLPGEDDSAVDFYLGLIFVIVSSVLLSLALLGSIVFRGGTIGTAWTLLLVGILFTTIGDVWFFYLEVFEGYFSGHPVELFWYVSYWIMTYALYKHREVF